MAPRLVEGEVTEQRCGFPPLDLVVLIAPAVGLGGEISGRRGLGGHIVGRLPVLRLVAVREVGSGRANLGGGGVRDPLHRTDYPVGCRSQPLSELE